jgi:hypothetical protein
MVDLKQVLAHRDMLVEPLLPGFQVALHELFAGNPMTEPDNTISSSPGSRMGSVNSIDKFPEAGRDR